MSACSLAAGNVIARGSGLSFDAIKLLAAGDQLWALWSDGSGLWWRRLNSRGAPVAQAQRLSERCKGGFDAAADRDSLVVACSLPSQNDASAEGVRLYRFDDKGRSVLDLPVGASGRDAHGVALMVDGSRFTVVFHEGSLGRHLVHEVTVEANRIQQSEVLSNPGRVAGHPAAWVEPKRHCTTWSETELYVEASSHTEVWAKCNASPARRVVETNVAEAAPSLTRFGHDQVLAFRDKRRGDKRSELYVTRLDERLQTTSPALRVGRANGEGAPELKQCGSIRAAILPREYGGEHYIAVHELDAQLKHSLGGHQYYANTREFVLASSTCNASGLNLLIGERAPPGKPGVELMTLRFSCP